MDECVSLSLSLSFSFTRPFFLPHRSLIMRGCNIFIFASNENEVPFLFFISVSSWIKA